MRRRGRERERERVIESGERERDSAQEREWINNMKGFCVDWSCKYMYASMCV